MLKVEGGAFNPGSEVAARPERGSPEPSLFSKLSGVAQVFNGLYRRFPIGSVPAGPERRSLPVVCGLETRATADCKSALRRGVAALNTYPEPQRVGLAWPGLMFAACSSFQRAAVQEQGSDS